MSRVKSTAQRDNFRVRVKVVFKTRSPAKSWGGFLQKNRAAAIDYRYFLKEKESSQVGFDYILLKRHGMFLLLTSPYHPCMVYLPTWMVDFYGINVGRYTSPMDGMGSASQKGFSFGVKIRTLLLLPRCKETKINSARLVWAWCWGGRI